VASAIKSINSDSVQRSIHVGWLVPRVHHAEEPVQRCLLRTHAAGAARRAEPRAALRAHVRPTPPVA